MTTYTLNPESPEARECLRHPYEMHRTLKCAAPDDSRILFRVDRAAGEVHVVWDRGMPLPDGMAVGMSQRELPALAAGMRCEFRVRAVPVISKCRRAPDGSRIRGKRHTIAGRPEQCDWLRRALASHGAHLLDANVVRMVMLGDRDGTHERKQAVPYKGVEFEGLLEVIDSERFAAALRHGIGRGKAFGFGLLLITWRSKQPAEDGR